MAINLKTIAAAALAALLTASCGSEVRVPDNATPTQEAADIFPEYRDIYIPQNIAPLNVQIKSDGDEFAACIKGEKGGEITAAAGKDGKLMFDTEAWHALLNENAGKTLSVTLYSHRDGQWLEHPAYQLHVAEPIDEYLSYRLIEPSYELYRQMGLYQRNLTNFTQTPIYENNRSYDSLQNHCVNCHNFQAYTTKRMLFHVRSAHGGTIIVENGKAKKWNMKCDSILSSTVYPTWHPTRNWVVFSSNQTGQAFHIDDRQKVEVMDFGSDLVFFDGDKGTLTNILKTDDHLETFPCWAPDGKKLYYTSAYVPQFKGTDTPTRQNAVTSLYDSLRYNLMSLTFDEQTRSFGHPVVEMDCAAIGKSVTLPRISPDRTLHIVFSWRLRTVPHLAHHVGPLREGPQDGRSEKTQSGKQRRLRQLSCVEQQRTLARCGIATRRQQLFPRLHRLFRPQRERPQGVSPAAGRPRTKHTAPEELQRAGTDARRGFPQRRRTEEGHLRRQPQREGVV